MKLHLCCGDIYLYTHQNYDVVGIRVLCPPMDARNLEHYYDGRKVGGRKRVHVDGYLDLAKTPWAFKDNSIEEVLIISAIEHFPPDTAKRIVGEIKRILVVGGMFLVDFPDIEETVRKYRNCPKFLIRHIYGSNRDEFAVHRWGYTRETFKELLGDGWQLNFREIVQHDYPAIGCEATKII